MEKKLRILLSFGAAFVIISSSHARECPNIGDKTIKNIVYEQLTGDWFLVASKPKLYEKCKNITITSSSDKSYKLHEEYFTKKLHVWHTKSSRDYDIVIPPKPSPILELKNKAWYSLGSEKFAVTFVDENFLVLYSCSKGVFITSENVRIFGRTNSDYKAETLPKGIKDALAKFKISTVDLFYRTSNECNHK